MPRNQSWPKISRKISTKPPPTIPTRNQINSSTHTHSPVQHNHIIASRLENHNNLNMLNSVHIRTITREMFKAKVLYNSITKCWLYKTWTSTWTMKCVTTRCFISLLSFCCGLLPFCYSLLFAPSFYLRFYSSFSGRFHKIIMWMCTWAHELAGCACTLMLVSSFFCAEEKKGEATSCHHLRLLFSFGAFVCFYLFFISVSELFFSFDEHKVLVMKLKDVGLKA